MSYISTRKSGLDKNVSTLDTLVSKLDIAVHLHILYIATFRLPFDEEQLEIPDNDKTDPFEKQPQGFINNNPRKNNPNVNGKNKNGGGAGSRTSGNGGS